jgi:hypothetical protein
LPALWPELVRFRPSAAQVVLVMLALTVLAVTLTAAAVVVVEPVVTVD